MGNMLMYRLESIKSYFCQCWRGVWEGVRPDARFKCEDNENEVRLREMWGVEADQTRVRHSVLYLFLIIGDLGRQALLSWLTS
jgi:hypothetical protein